MLMIRSWNRCVCSTHPRLTVDRVAEPDQVGLGQPVGLAPHAAADPGARAPAATARRPACVSWPRTNHGTATSSTNMSASSLRQTNELHSGWSTARCRPTSSHFATRRERRGDQAGDARTAARPAGPRPAPPSRSVDVEQQRPRRPGRAPTETAAGTSRQTSTSAALHLDRRVDGAKVRLSSPPAALRRSSTGGLPSHDVPALARSGAAESTATRLFLGTTRARARSSPSCRGTTACRSWPARSASSRRTARRSRSGCRRRGTRRRPTVVIAGSISTVEASTSAADRRRRAPAATPA